VNGVQHLRAAHAGSQRLWWERAVWAHPEWWSLALSALAWLLIVFRIDSPGAGRSHHAGDHAAAAMGQSGFLPDVAAETFAWLLMVAAMMFPLLIDSIRTAAARSLWTRRHRAIAEFLTGYLVPWTIAGIVTIMLVRAASVSGSLGSWMWVAAGFAAAAVWQLTPVKLRALRSCHRTMPLAPRGWRADRDCLRYGWTIGGRCVVSCWAMMAGCVLAAHSVPAMLCVTAVGSAERFIPRLDRRLTAGVLLGFALLGSRLTIGE
jgi:Predicted metal-binding integral membrane protein (DUF2182)